MCMTYKGIDYHYAFEFKIPIENSDKERILNVVISNYREKTHDFSGLCLENELMVISAEKMLFAAFFDIINSIVNITTENEKNYNKTYGIYPTPLLTVTDESFLKKFNIYKQEKKSLDYYERLKEAFERPKSINENFTRNIITIKIDNRYIRLNKLVQGTVPDLIDCHNLVLFNYLVQKNEVPIKDPNYFRL